NHVVALAAGTHGTFFATSPFRQRARALAGKEGDIMAVRSNWEGFIRLSLISMPVRAFSASVQGRGKIAFHMIHKTCNSRIHYQKVCPIHGEVSKDEIVSGYEYAKGEYILVDPGELDKLRT